MTDEAIRKLQNGSDIRGIALEGVENEKVNLTPETARRFAGAFVQWLAQRKGKMPAQMRVSVGCDSRISSPSLLNGAVRGLIGHGVSVGDCGLASTPAMFMSTVMEGFQYDGAIMVTASHLPFNRNGLKFFTQEGGLEKNDITKLVDLVLAGEAPASGQTGQVAKVDLISAYAAGLVDKIRAGAKDPSRYDQPLRGLKVIVDAGNGAGGFFVHKVLEPLGADTMGSQFLEPDGSFPNHIPNPENEAAMESIRHAVLANKADLGIIFDTDVDRAGAVDVHGGEINRNRIIALMSAIVLEEHPGSVIVTDSITSDELKVFIEQTLGGVHRRFKRGYKNVINEAKRLNRDGIECCLAMETSGHGALKENYFLDDGAYLISKILIQAARLRRQGKTVDRLLSDLKEPAESFEFRFKIEREDYRKYGADVLENLGVYAAGNIHFNIAADNYEGLRVSFAKDEGDGWFLLRMSLHDPIMPLNIESKTPGGSKLIARQILTFLDSFDGLDLTPLKEFLQ